MSNSQLQEVANNTVVKHFTDSENEKHMTVDMPNGNSMEVNTTKGWVISTCRNKVQYHGVLTVAQFVALQQQLLTN